MGSDLLLQSDQSLPFSHRRRPRCSPTAHGKLGHSERRAKKEQEPSLLQGRSSPSLQIDLDFKDEDLVELPLGIQLLTEEGVAQGESEVGKCSRVARLDADSIPEPARCPPQRFRDVPLGMLGVLKGIQSGKELRSLRP